MLLVIHVGAAVCSGLLHDGT